MPITEKQLTTGIIIGTMLTLVLMPLLYWNSIMYPYITLKVAVFQSLVELMAALWLVLIIFFKQHRARWTPIAIAVLGFLGAIIVSAIAGVDFWNSFWSTQARLTGIFFLLHAAVFFFILATTIQTAAIWRWFVWISVGIGTIGAIAAFLEKFIFVIFYSSVTSPVQFGRSNSLFGNPSFLAGYLLLNVFLALTLIAQEKNIWLKRLAGVCSVIMALGIFRTQTIGDMGALGIGILLLMLYFIRQWWRLPEKRLARNVLIGIIVAGIIGGGIVLSTRRTNFWQTIPGLGRIAAIELSSSNIQNRFTAWQSGWQSFVERPLLGYGWENFNIAFNRHYNPILLTANFSETYWDKPHNIFLEYLYTGGIVTFAVFLGFISVVGYEIRKSKTVLATILGIGLIAYLIQGLVIFDSPGVYLMLVLYLAYIDWLYQSTAFQRHL